MARQRELPARMMEADNLARCAALERPRADGATLNALIMRQKAGQGSNSRAA